MKHSAGDSSPLKTPITSMDMSQQFTQQALRNGYTTLDEFYQLTLSGILHMDWLTKDLRQELLDKLEWIQDFARK
jgi:hypothetical protein